MNNSAIKVLFKKELKSYFTTPLGYVFVIIFLFGLGHITFEPGKGSFFIFRKAELTSLFNYVPWLFIFLIPAITMRLWAEERKSGTIELLLTLPVSVKEAVVAKFLASWAFASISLLGTFPFVMTVLYLGEPDLTVIFVGYLACILLAACFISIGMFFSALTKNQVISFILAVVVCNLFMMAGSPPVLEFFSAFLPQFFVEHVEALSILNHFESMVKGVVRIGDIWFYAVMIMGWLYASILLLNERKAA